MRVKRITGCCLSHMLLILVIVLSLFPTILCADEDEYHQTGDPALLPSITQKVNGILTNMTRIMSNDIGTNWAFCVKDLCVIIRSSLLLSVAAFKFLTRQSTVFLPGTPIGMGHSIIRATRGS